MTTASLEEGRRRGWQSFLLPSHPLFSASPLASSPSSYPSNNIYHTFPHLFFSSFTTIFLTLSCPLLSHFSSSSYFVLSFPAFIFLPSSSILPQSLSLFTSADNNNQRKRKRKANNTNMHSIDVLRACRILSMATKTCFARLRLACSRLGLLAGWPAAEKGEHIQVFLLFPSLITLLSRDLILRNVASIPLFFVTFLYGGESVGNKQTKKQEKADVSDRGEENRHEKNRLETSSES